MCSAAQIWIGCVRALSLLCCSSEQHELPPPPPLHWQGIYSSASAHDQPLAHGTDLQRDRVHTEAASVIHRHAKERQPSVAVPDMPTHQPAGETLTVIGVFNYACHLIAAKYIQDPTILKVLALQQQARSCIPAAVIICMLSVPENLSSCRSAMPCAVCVCFRAVVRSERSSINRLYTNDMQEAMQLWGSPVGTQQVMERLLRPLCTNWQPHPLQPQ